MRLSCSSCGYRSENRAFFRRVKNGALGLGRWFCLGCKPFPKGSLGFASLALPGAFALFGWLALRIGDGLEPGGYGLLLISGSILLTPLTLVVHELGHAAVAALLGRRVYQISIGSGSPLATFETNHTAWVIGRDMSFGYVIQMPLGIASRRGDVAVLAAGALANLTVAIALTRLTGAVSEWSNAAAALMVGSILSNLFVGVGALVPGGYVRDGRSWPSDGRQIFQRLRQGRSTVDWQAQHDAFTGWNLVRAKRWEEAKAHYEAAFARHPDEPTFLGGLMHILAHSRGYEAAMVCAKEHDAFLRRERQIPEPAAVSWSYVWSMAAWAFIRAPTGDISRARIFSRKALEAQNSPYAQAVYGALLARTGEPEDGLSEILASLKAMESSSDKLEFCDFIVTERLESDELKTSDFQAYATHLRRAG